MDPALRLNLQVAKSTSSDQLQLPLFQRQEDDPRPLVTSSPRCCSVVCMALSLKATGEFTHLGAQCQAQLLRRASVGDLRGTSLAPKPWP